MTTTQSPTVAAARQTRNATEKTAENFKQGVREVTEQADQLFGQLPTVDLAQGVERYFEFVQRVVDINRELATSWADAVTSLSGVVREQTEKVGQLVHEQSEKAGELIAEQVDKVESTTGEQVDTVEHTAKDQARRVRQATNGHSDERNERLIGTK